MTAKPPPLSEPITIAKISKNRNRTESVHIGFSSYEGHNLINVRIYAAGTDGVDRPTVKGISMSVRKLPALTVALLKAEDRAREIGLLDGTEPAE
jgi:hypothetical protein